jgi:peptide/nickel transport system ATP-binding protein
MRNSTDVVLTVRDLVVEFRLSKDRVVKAVSGLSFDVIKGEVLAIVGESGCGKTTLGRAILQLPPPNSGEVIFEGTDLTQLPKENLRSARTAIQMIFQDPISSLDPRMTVKQLIDEPLEIWQRGDEQERSVRINELLNNVGLDSELVLDRHAYEFSGGQCQRISIARAIALDPVLLVCDEPVSALDVSIQAQILNLLQDMKEKLGLTLIFISHDLAVVKAVSTRVLVMYLGKICEVATPDDLYAHPAHHYSRALIAAVPIPDPELGVDKIRVTGEPPSPVNPPSGCRFRTRCESASQRCAAEEPQLREVGLGHFVACHHPVTN